MQYAREAPITTHTSPHHEPAGPRRPSAGRPRARVRREFLRALGGLAIGPVHAAGSVLCRAELRAAVARDLATAATPSEPEPIALPDRPLRLFLSCAEPSGETHAVALVRELMNTATAWGAPAPVLTGLGGERLAAAGVRTVGDPVARAAMGGDALRSVGFYRALLERAVEAMDAERVDACIPVDSPALHVPLAHLAHGSSIPVVHHVTPQYWGWAPWRVAGYRRAVDLALTILPFEPAWFARHGVRSAHVGHPQVDALAGVEAPGWGEDSGRTSLVLLPGSRRGVLERNLPFFLRVLQRVRDTGLDPEVVLPLAKEELAPALAGIDPSARIRVSREPLHAELARARVALSVSGTVLLDLLHHRIPTSVVYPARNGLQRRLQGCILTVPWFASPNLLAGREILPETTHHDGEPANEVAAGLVRWLTDAEAHAAVRRDLDLAAERLGPPGAARRAAAHVLRAAVGVLPEPPRRP